MLPHRGVVGRELLVPADERVETLVIVGERLEPDPVGRTVDLDPGLADVCDAGDLDIDERRRRGDLGRTVRRPRVGIEAA